MAELEEDGPWNDYRSDPSGPWNDYGSSPASSQPNPQPQTKFGWLMDKVNQAKAWTESRRPKNLKDALLKGIGNAGLGVPPVGDIPFLPNQTVAGAAKGLSDLVLGPTQLVSHITGVGTDSVDKAVKATDDYYKGNFGKATAGEVTGQALSALLPGLQGSGFLRGAARVAQAGLTPAAITPEANTDNYWGKKGLEAGAGVAGAGLSAGASKLLQKVKPTLQAAARAKKPEQIISDLESTYTGEPAEALQGQVNSNFQDAVSTGRKGYAPVRQGAEVDLTPGADSLADSIERAKNSANVEHPDALALMSRYMDRWKQLGTTSFDDAAKTLSSLKAADHDLAKKGARAIDRKPIQDAIDALRGSMEKADPEAFAGLGLADANWAENVAKPFFRPDVTRLRNAPTTADVQTILDRIRPGTSNRGDVGRAAAFANAGSAEPIAVDWIQDGLQRSTGRPGGYQAWMQPRANAMQQIDPEIAQAIQDSIEAAKVGKFTGFLGNMGLAKAGPAAGLVGAMNPAYSGPGLGWKAVQSGPAKAVMGALGQAPTGLEGSAINRNANDEFLALLLSKLGMQ